MKIVIVGGGFSGWIAALMINKLYKDVHEITLIESDKIKTIGVGEGGTGFLRGLINGEGVDWGLNEKDFIKYCNATPKLGIHFREWKKDFSDFIEPLDSPNHSLKFKTYPTLMSYAEKNIPVHLSTINGRLIEYKQSSFIQEKENYSGTYSHSYHFDSGLAGEYVKSHVIKDISYINSFVKEIFLDNDGMVNHLLLENEEKVFGDFFIDSSGFSRIFKEKLNMNFIEYPEITLNSAIPFQLKLSDFSNENFVTTAWAQKYGWMWMIPKQDSIGCGYIYDNNYIDEQGAQKEIEEKLGIPISVNRKINFRAGRLKNFWNKNVLSVGLASSFLEPLEATSIHGTIAQLSNFIFYYLKENIQDTMNSECIKEYNFQTGKLIDNFKIFILLHYVNAREDTDFWKNMNKSAMKNKEIKKIVNIAKTRLLNDFDTESKNIFGPVDSSLLNVALVAYNIFTKDAAKKESLLLLNKEEAIDHENWLCDYIENNNWISNKDFLSIISNH